ncbi:hypothetical protein Tco_0787266 [Tanacetum coccineum]
MVFRIPAFQDREQFGLGGKALIFKKPFRPKKEGKLIQKLRQKGVYEESFSRHAAWTGGKLIQFMHTTMVPEQVKTMKIQAGIQVSRLRELTRQLQLWKRFGKS